MKLNEVNMNIRTVFLLILLLNYSDCFPTYCLNGAFQCLDGVDNPVECLPLNSMLCDGNTDCDSGGGDELEALCGTAVEQKTCTDQFKRVCPGNAASQCISPSKFCDGVMDCDDGGDEKWCPRCRDDQYQCDFGATCLYRQKLCDGNPDCGDSSDEALAKCTYAACNDKINNINPYVSCLDTDDNDGDGCIRVSLICAQRNNPSNNAGYCPKATMNLGCPACSRLNEFMCYDGSKCLTRKLLCNGANDCADSSDEHVGNLCQRDAVVGISDCGANENACLQFSQGDHCIASSASLCVAGLANYDTVEKDTGTVGTGTCDEVVPNLIAVQSFQVHRYCGANLDASVCTGLYTGPCDTCTLTLAGTAQCNCATGESHPWDDATEGFITTECATPCVPAACGTAVESTGCVGTDDKYKCLCNPGYFRGPLPAEVCTKRRCDVNADCMGTDGLDIHRCVFEPPTLAELAADPKRDLEEAKNKFCLCAPGYEGSNYIDGSEGSTCSMPIGVNNAGDNRYFIRHGTEFCVSVDASDELFLTKTCDTLFEITATNQIQDGSDCFAAVTIAQNEKIERITCNAVDTQQYNLVVSADGIIQLKSDTAFCFHRQSGNDEPVEGTKLVLWDDCNLAPKTTFTISTSAPVNWCTLQYSCGVDGYDADAANYEAAILNAVPRATACTDSGDATTPNVCACDTDAGYVLATGEWYCVAAPLPCVNADCGLLTISTVLQELGTCTGTPESFTCACKTIEGVLYVNPIRNGDVDLTSCAAPCDVVNCGIGATGCSGSISDYTCDCDTNFIRIEDVDKSKCFFECPDTTGQATALATIKRICGDTAIGCLEDENEFSEDFCECPSDSEKKDGKCLGCLSNLVECCGVGAVSCTGSVAAPVCVCGYGYKLDDGKCVEMSCSERTIDPCVQGTCNGGFWSWTCNCDAGFTFDPVLRLCIGCDVKLCGSGYVHGVLIDYASACALLPAPYSCECKDGFVQQIVGSDVKCVRAACENTQCNLDETAAVEFGTCYGDFVNFTCVCNHNYELVDFPLNNGQIQKLCSPVDCSKSHRTLCGEHGFCSGPVQDYNCVCDPGYMVFNNLCHPYDCLEHKLCGTTGVTGCSFGKADGDGSFLDSKLICECNTPGYTPSVDGTLCVEELCDGSNFNDACGEGAIGCTGTVINPVCQCDSKNHYYPDTTFKKCLSTCLHNEEVLTKCGAGNTCHGTFKDYTCVCQAFGFTANPDDPEICDEIACNVATMTANEHDVAVRVCGTGATSCFGTWVHPKCTCDFENGFVTSSNLKQCVEDRCSNNEEVYKKCRIGVAGNSCFGTYTAATCNCGGKGYKLSKDGTACEEIPCNSNYHGMSDQEIGCLACGEGALSCMGTIPNPRCNCDIGNAYYPGSLAKSCVIGDCRVNRKILDMCGPGNSCQGPENNYMCLCNAKGYEYDTQNPQKCKEIDCANSMSVCGEGVVRCSGTIISPTCECDSNHVPAFDGRSCIRPDQVGCSLSEEIRMKCRMDDGNICRGSVGHFVCICQANGYVEVGQQQCKEIPCDASNAWAVCGEGAVSCSRTMRDPVCECDSHNNFVPANNLRSCQKENCASSEHVLRRCGPGNTCIGTVDKYECVCKARGFMKDPIDKTICLEAMCDESIDPVSVCGQGAIRCHGYIRSPSCECDFQLGYVTSSNGMTCITAECRHNPDVQKQCGIGNGCRGTFKSWACLCTAKGYEADISDPSRCNLGHCSESTDAVRICGEGAVGCEGPLNRPTCKCEGYFVSSNDGTSCQLADCRSHPDAKRCGPGSPCRGTVKSFQCLCNAKGYEYVPGDLRQCREVQCSKDNAIEACGEGALDCEGTFNRPHCYCDTSRNFITYGNAYRCIASDCRNNEEGLAKCGPGNTCQGTFSSFQCVCNAKGFMRDPHDATRCIEVMCDEVADISAICGKGALGCEGSTREPLCICDTERSYIPSANGQTCVLANCQTNPIAQERCGKGNGCSGTYKHFSCLCTSFGYQPDPMDVTRCILRECTDEQAGRICGDGATGCSGSVLNPICTCETEGYMQAGDMHSCQPKPCRFNKNINCLDGNTCSGTYFSATCNCPAHNYLVDHENYQTCRYASCNVGKCGGSSQQGVEGLFAHDCEGPHIAPMCHCKEGYEGTGTALCTPIACTENPQAHCDGHGKCDGTYLAWTCNCEAPKYIKNPDNAKACIEAPCKEESCGKSGRDGVVHNHAHTCMGPEMDRKCQCKEGYEGTDTPYCVPLACSENPEATCSHEGQCSGTYFKWKCVCRTPDYIQDPTNPTSCIPAPCRREQCGQKHIPNSNAVVYFAYDCEGTALEPMCKCKDAYSGFDTPYCRLEYCSAGTDAEKVCGKGATHCEGPLDHPICHCDESRLYLPSSDGTQCVISDCESHPDFKKCGPGNKCQGTIKSFQCICSADGWENVPGDFMSCREMVCNDDNKETVCGLGTIGCEGTYLNPKCFCDIGNNYVAHKDGGKCVEADCSNAHDFIKRCGRENTCQGSIESYRCICNAKGFIYDPMDASSCKEVMCTDLIDFAKICGEGATGCIGSSKSPHCLCDLENNFVPSADGKECITATCMHNAEAIKNCGKGNTCMGSFKEYVCLCTADGYEPDPSDRTTCKLMECEYSQATKICGDGATGCSGSVLNPICTCETEGYMRADDMHTCELMPCRFNKNLDCGKGNTCSGTYFSASCVCNGPAYMVDPDDSQTCKPAPCSITECGQDETTMALYAEDCYGTYSNPGCHCKLGYSGFGTPYCNMMSCSDNPDADCGSGGICDGTYFKWKCVCKGPEYIADIFDTKKCVKAPCKKEMCGFSTKYGAPYYFASECMGNYGDRKCKCKEGFHGDHTPYCKPKPCTENSDATCDDNGQCKGTFSEWTCLCNSPHFIQDPMNAKSCIEAPCKVESCGRGFINGFHMNFADSCEGTFKTPSCNCKEMFTGTGSHICEVDYCTPTSNAVEVCGKGATSCDGPLTKPVCYCDESRDYVPSKDGTTCVLAHCSSNPDTKNCGHGNTCSGTKKSWHCICSGAGWKVDPLNHKRCEEIECTDELATKACGNGAMSCKGTMNQPICKCDVSMNYISANDGTCQMSDCSASSDVLAMCGPGNGCHGTLRSYQCVCNGKGWTDHPTDPKQCVEVMCIDVSDITAVCGEGALRCTGSTRSPTCICNNDGNYITSDDGLSCIVASCENNLEAQEKCGKGNKCSGTYKHYACVCSAYGYEAHPTDLKQCVLRECSSIDDAKQICGDGATGCSGSVLNPTCTCETEGFMPAGDMHSCQPRDCRFNKDLDCGKGNTCSGTYFSASCVCNGPAFMVDKENPLKCKEAPCNYKECGHIMNGHIPHYYAESCDGTYNNRQCSCKVGYTGTDTAYCEPESCNKNPLAMCDGMSSRCKGTVDEWSCVCDLPKYMIDPMNNLACIEAPCKIEQCGFGYIDRVKEYFATSCTGKYSNPICNCRMNGFVSTFDKKCEIDPDCTNSPKGELCERRGQCVGGNYFTFRCNCNSPMFRQREDDIQVCEDAPCELEQCGETKDGKGNSLYHATKCYGTYSKPSCNCKQGYHVDADTGECVPGDCSIIANVCDGKGMCRGTTVDYTCECDMHYEHPGYNMKSCKPVSCNEIEDVCDNVGVCDGTIFVFNCHCNIGYQQKKVDGVPTCVRASCTDDQCGGTTLSPFGECNDGGYFDSYNCTCEPGFTHPRLPNEQPILSKCDYECDVSHCGLLGTKECIGTLNAFHCKCEDGFMHPRDSSGQHINTYCDAKCDHHQCGGTKSQPFGNCDGTKKEFVCSCTDGYSHPLDRTNEPILTKCRETCKDDQCGLTDGQIHGKCDGAKAGYRCTCGAGFDHAKNYAGYPIYMFCKDEDECENKDRCDPNAKCVNTPGSYKCECNEPYVGEGSRMGKCYLNGGWGKWQHQQCSQTCGGGSSEKTRDCLVPMDYRTDDTCQGKDSMTDNKCNHHPCEDLCELSKCECSYVKQFVNGAAPNEDLEYFESIKGFKFHHATSMLTKFSRIASTDLCKDNSLDGSIEDIKKKLADDMGSIRNALHEYSKAKSEMRIYINCNENPDIRETLFKTYKTITTHMFMTKFVLSDLEVERKSIYKRAALCDSRDDMSFGDMMKMLGNRDPNEKP